jgi:uncharacterized protein YbjQ (UPF0145 family)
VSLSASDKRDIAEVLNVVIEARNHELYAEIAAGFVEVINGLMEDFAQILEARNEKALDQMRQRALGLRAQTKREAEREIDLFMQGLKS